MLLPPPYCAGLTARHVDIDIRKPHCRALLVEVPGAAQVTQPCPKVSSLVLVAFAMVSKTLLTALAPRCVVVPLFPGHNDIMTLLEALAEAQFTGRVLILTPPLPNCAMVLAELRAHCPGLRLRLLRQP